MKLFPIAALFCLAATAALTMTPAPAQAQRLTALSAPNTSSSAKASAKKAEPLNGFQDIKWGDSIAKVTKLLESKGATVEKVIGSDNTLRVSSLQVAGYETRDIALRFGSEGFYQASVPFFSTRTAKDANQYSEIRLIIAERFGEPAPERSAGGLGGLGGFGGNGTVSEWRFDQPNKEVATLRLMTNPSAQTVLEYRATDRAEREEARIRAEKAKSL